ncbi:hypothetical protein L2E82_45580 [Cichorium intybus]|uniref:Uncharacterized protein n=1 Tax=Cichorium intybus TaxID=13427 RepID=A0ACB8ZTB4_CICIN|nr:hypothetical protein L2E82_45580 [Cichorium intybus]
MEATMLVGVFDAGIGDATFDGGSLLTVVEKVTEEAMEGGGAGRFGRWRRYKVRPSVVVENNFWKALAEEIDR